MCHESVSTLYLWFCETTPVFEVLTYGIDGILRLSSYNVGLFISNRQDFGILHSRSRLQLSFPLLLASVFAEAEKPPTTVVDKLRHQVETDEFKCTTIESQGKDKLVISG